MVKLRLLPAEGTVGHGGEIACCSYSSDSQFVLSGGWDGHLRLWESTSGMHRSDLRVSDRPVSACALAPDAKYWLSATLDGMLARWDAETGQRVSIFLAHPRPIAGMVFAPDGRTLATASWDCSLILWEAHNERVGRTLAGHTDIVTGCRFTPDGCWLLSWSHDRTVRLWDVEQARQLACFAGHTDRVLSAAMSPDGRWAASGARDHGLKLWDLQKGRLAGSLSRTAAICGCFFLLDAESLVTVEANGHLCLYSLPDLAPQAEITAPLSIQCGDLAPSGGQMALGGADGRVHLVAVDGFDEAPLVVTPIRKVRRTATKLQRLFGKSYLTHTFTCTCPACRQSFELPADDPTQVAACPSCRRQLRLSGVQSLAAAL